MKGGFGMKIRTTVAGTFGTIIASSLVIALCLSRGYAEQPVTATFIAPTIPQGTAKNRGCRDGGAFGINRINPSWVSVEPNDAPKVAEGVIRESHTATNDNPAFHVSHDWNADIVLDAAYNGLNSDGNPIKNGERRLEIEWETSFFPPRFWAAPGDRAWMLGRWIFDCGHPNPYRSEIHPPKAVAFTRLEPVIFAGDQRPSNSNVTYVYIHGRGGYYKTPVIGRNYEFDIILPSKPVRFSSLKTAILGLPFGGPSPTLKLVENSNPAKLHVTYPLANQSDPFNTRRFGAIIATAWQSNIAQVIAPGYRLLKVTFDSIKINTDHDPAFSGEWRLWVRTNGEWFEVTGLGDVDNGETIRINKSVNVIVPDNGKLEIQTSGWEDDCDSNFRNKDSNIKLWKASLSDLKCELNGNDSIGILEQDFVGANNFGIGSHNDPSARNGDADTSKDFNLRYRVELVKSFPNNSGKLDPVISPTPVVPPSR